MQMLTHKNFVVLHLLSRASMPFASQTAPGKLSGTAIAPLAPASTAAHNNINNNNNNNNTSNNNNSNSNNLSATYTVDHDIKPSG